MQAAEVAKRLLEGHATDENADTGVNSTNPNIPDDQVGSSHVSIVMPNQPALRRAGSHGVARCSAAWSLRGVRRYCGTRQGESVTDWWGRHRPHLFCVFAHTVLVGLTCIGTMLSARVSGGFGGRGSPWRDSPASGYTRRQRGLVWNQAYFGMRNFVSLEACTYQPSPNCSALSLLSVVDFLSGAAASDSAGPCSSSRP